MNFFYGVIIFSLLFVGILPNVLAEESNCDDLGVHNPEFKKYIPVEITDYSISTGEFIELCVQPDHLWYKIYLNTLEPGSLTITIPKQVVDLKQFDYASCNGDNLHTNSPFYRDTTVKQISQTKESRTLEFTWVEPMSYIEYFVTYGVTEKFNYLEPNLCISEVESGEKSAEITVRSLPNRYKDCTQQLDYSHQISNGKIKRICFTEYEEIIISLKDIISNTILTIDIPYTDMPLITTRNHQGFMLFVDDIMYPLKVTHQYPKYQTFDIYLISDSKYVELLYAFRYIPVDDIDRGMDHDYNLTIPFLDLEKTPCKLNFVSITKYDNSKSVCVKQMTAEKLIQRGYGFLDD